MAEALGSVAPEEIDDPELSALWLEAAGIQRELESVVRQINKILVGKDMD